MKKFIPFALITVCGTALFAEESSQAKETTEQKSSMEYSVVDLVHLVVLVEVEEIHEMEQEMVMTA